MKNHRYRVEDKDFIVSEEEHQKIKSLMSQGKSIISLQSGNMVNLSYFKYETETDLPVDGNESLLALKGKSNILEGIGDRRDFDLESHNDFFTRMGWEHNPDCRCKVLEKAKAETFK